MTAADGYDDPLRPPSCPECGGDGHDGSGGPEPGPCWACGGEGLDPSPTAWALHERALQAEADRLEALE